MCISNHIRAGLWLVVLCALALGCGQATTGCTNLYKKAQYHNRELGKIMTKLEAFHNIEKCSAPVKKTDEELVCSHVNPKVQATTFPISSSIRQIVSYQETNWVMPEPFLLRVKAKGYSKMIKFEFEVVHTSKANIYHYGSLDGETKVVNVPENKTGEFMMSVVPFNMDTSDCIEYGSKWVNFVITSGVPSRHKSEVSFQLCNFDLIRNQGKNQDDVVFSRMFPFPKIRVLSDVGETITITRGKNTSIDIKMRLFNQNSYNVHAELWDWKAQKFIISHITLDSYYDERIITIDNSRKFGTGDRILKVDILSEEAFTYTYNEDRDGSVEEVKRNGFDAELRITVEIGSEELSGKLLLNCERHESRFFRKFVYTEAFRLKLPYKTSVFPDNLLNMEAAQAQFECDKDGNKNSPHYGKHCTISCEAFGTDLQNISIIKTHPYRAPVKSSSFITEYNVFTIQDVGPASEENDGVYRCTAVTKNGTMKFVDLILCTCDCNEITNFTLDDLGNSTARLECTVSGRLPLDISIATITLDGNNQTKERIDNKVGAVATRKSFDYKTKKLTLLISTKVLQYPIEVVVCKVSNARGQDTSTIYLNDDYNPYIPKMIDEKSTIQKSDDGLTINITCVASAGGESIDMFVSYGYESKYNRIDDKPENVRNVTNMDDEVLLTLIVPTGTLRRYLTVYCGAENKFSTDYKEFYLPDYGIDIKLNY